MTDDSKEALEAAVPVLTAVASRTNVLARIHWPRSVEQAFFAKGGDELPEPVYAVDRATSEENVRALERLRKALTGDDPLRELLRRTATSYRDANRLLLAVGTPRFYELSCEIYGGAQSTALDEDTTNLDLAEHLLGRLSHQSLPATEGPASIAPPGEPPLDHRELVQALAERLGREQPTLEVSVVVSDDVAPKVIAGARQVRVREGARFTPEEARSLFVHEIETHALTAQNGSAQPHLSFLRSGGPRSTRTQEGLAVFAELFDRSLSAARLLRLAERVRMVAMAEGGASFLDVYRYLTGSGVPAREAYLDTVRVFRGGVVAGGSPFTKDTVYLAGLIQVYNFLRASVTRGTRHVAETLVAGRVALDDMGLLLVLREQGLLAPPVYVPGWLSNWQTLLPYLAFTSFLNEVSLPPPLVRTKARRAPPEAGRGLANPPRGADAAPAGAPPRPGRRPRSERDRARRGRRDRRVELARVEADQHPPHHVDHGDRAPPRARPLELAAHLGRRPLVDLDVFRHDAHAAPAQVVGRLVAGPAPGSAVNDHGQRRDAVGPLRQRRARHLPPLLRDRLPLGARHALHRVRAVGPALGQVGHVQELARAALVARRDHHPHRVAPLGWHLGRVLNRMKFALRVDPRDQQIGRLVAQLERRQGGGPRPRRVVVAAPTAGRRRDQREHEREAGRARPGHAPRPPLSRARRPFARKPFAEGQPFDHASVNLPSPSLLPTGPLGQPPVTPDTSRHAPGRASTRPRAAFAQRFAPPPGPARPRRGNENKVMPAAPGGRRPDLCVRRRRAQTFSRKTAPKAERPSRRTVTKRSAGDFNATMSRWPRAPVKKE